VQCGFDKRREYATKAVINGAYRDGDEKGHRCTVVKMPEGLALQLEKVGPGEGTSTEEMVGSHIPLLFSCFYSHLANGSKVSGEEGACEPSMEEARRAFSTGREYR
jgi:hypothetical protein